MKHLIRYTVLGLAGRIAVQDEKEGEKKRMHATSSSSPLVKQETKVRSSGGGIKHARAHKILRLYCGPRQEQRSSIIILINVNN